MLKLRLAGAEFLAALCDTLRVEGCLTLGSDEEDDAYAFGRALVGRWCAETAGYKSRLRPFVGDATRKGSRRGARLKFAASVLAGCGLTPDEALRLAPDLLSAAFGQLA